MRIIDPYATRTFLQETEPVGVDLHQFWFNRVYLLPGSRRKFRSTTPAGGRRTARRYAMTARTTFRFLLKKEKRPRR
jgi:hypothetical protein